MTRAAALAVVALALAGCQTTAEQSARLERDALGHASASAQQGLSVARTSTEVKVLDTAVVRGSEGTAAVVTVRNLSARALFAVPLAITVSDAAGRVLYQNNAAGLEAGLVSVPSLPAHGTLTWVDDQVPPGGQPARVSARVGEAAPASASVPVLTVAGIRLSEDPASGLGASGTVENGSRVAQSRLVIFGVARKSGRVVAAGRAVLAELASGTQMPFQMFFVGDLRGARLKVSAPASTAG